MPVRVSCPYCNTAFDLAAVPPARRSPCPRCGESVPVRGESEEPGPPPSLNGEPAPVHHAAPPPRSAGLLVASVGLTLLVLAGFAVWIFVLRPANPSGPSTSATKPTLAPATKPPPILSGLKYLPRDTQVLLAVQPSPLLQYAERTNQNPKKVFETLGLPKALFDGFADAGFPPEAIDHVTVGASVTDPRFVAALVVRTPIDESRVREKLKAKVIADRRERMTADLGGVPVTLTRADDRTLLFAMRESDLDAAGKPSAGLPDLRSGLRESVDRLSPASVAWLATDSTDWAQVPGLKLAAGFAGQPELPKRLEGVRAAAVGLSFEPNLRLRVQVRAADAATAKGFGDALGRRLADAKATVTTADEWTAADVPFDPPQKLFDLLRKGE
jgi:hypothetical protein